MCARSLLDVHYSHVHINDQKISETTETGHALNKPTFEEIIDNPFSAPSCSKSS